MYRQTLWWVIAPLALACLLAFDPASLARCEDAKLRTMRYSPRSADEAQEWQANVRAQLWPLLKLNDLVAARDTIALNSTQLLTQPNTGFQLQEVEINSTATRRIKVLIGRPTASGAGAANGDRGPAKRPAVVCIHGHGGNRRVVFEETSIYRGFAAELARRGFVTIAADVGQHEVYEADRSLMGERLWDLMRCVDYLRSLPDVAGDRIGCGGLSLGGEMAMWLGGMDTRVAATASCGFLTRMDQMERNHCLCWKFDGLRELVDFADLYALTAPRALLCQNGLLEPPSQFPVPLAAAALAEVAPVYRDLGVPERAVLLAHPEGHVIHLPSLMAFFAQSLALPATSTP